MEKKTLKPAPGMKVRMPVTGAYLPEDGAEVELTSYWRRRIEDGDVVPAAKPKQPKE